MTQKEFSCMLDAAKQELNALVENRVQTLVDAQLRLLNKVQKLEQLVQELTAAQTPTKPVKNPGEENADNSVARKQPSLDEVRCTAQKAAEHIDKHWPTWKKDVSNF